MIEITMVGNDVDLEMPDDLARVGSSTSDLHACVRVCVYVFVCAAQSPKAHGAHTNAHCGLGIPVGL